MQDELCERVVSDPEVTKLDLKPGARLPVSPKDAFFVVLSGAVAVELFTEDADAKTLEVLASGDCVPHWLEGDAASQRLGLRAVVASSVARVPLGSLARVMLHDPTLASVLGAKLANQHSEILSRLAASVQRSALCRVSSALDYLSDKVGRQCPYASGTQLPLSQVEIARVAHHTRQTTNEILTDLQGAGLVRGERSMVCVLDRAGVRTVAGGNALEYTWAPAPSCKFVHPEQALTCYPLRHV